MPPGALIAPSSCAPAIRRAGSVSKSFHTNADVLPIVSRPLPLPTLALKRRPPTLFDYTFDDIAVVGYQSHAHIRAAVAV